MNEPYIRVVDNEIMIDRNMANFDIVNYQIVNGIYQSKCNVIREYAKSGLSVTNDDDYMAPQKIKLLSQVKIGFKDLFDLYCHIKEGQPMLSMPDYRLGLIESRNDLVKRAYDILGAEEVRRMNYHQSNIRRELISRSGKGQDYKVVEMINAKYASYPTKPVREWKETLQGIYNSVGMERTAKATDLKQWYEVKEHTKTINGRSVACITIIRSKFMRVERPE